MSEQDGQLTHFFPAEENEKPVAEVAECGWVIDRPRPDCPLCQQEKCIQFRGRMDPMKVYHVRK